MYAKAMSNRTQGMSHIEHTLTHIQLIDFSKRILHN